MDNVRRFSQTMLVFSCVVSIGMAIAADPPSPKSKFATTDVKPGHVPVFPRVIVGRLTDRNGKPIADALVEWGPDYPHDAAHESTRSTADGTYRLEAKRAGGRYKLGVSATGFSPVTREGLVPGPPTDPTVLDFQLSPETSLEVTLVGRDGKPVPNLDVIPMTPESGFNSSFSMVQQPEPIPGHDQPVRCDEQGRCRLRQLLPAPEELKLKAEGDTPNEAEFKERFNQMGWLSLRITQDGEWVHACQVTRKDFSVTPGRLQVVIPDYRNPNVTAKHNGALFGQVVDPNGLPVPQYQVTLRYRPEPLKVNNPDGCFRWGKTLDPTETYEAHIFAKGFAPAEVRIRPNTTSPDNPRRIVLTPHNSVEFQLIDGRTNEPLGDVPVVTGLGKKSGFKYVEWNDLKNYADGHHSMTSVLHLKSDATGRFTVPEGEDPAMLVILTLGYARQIVLPASRPASNGAGVIPIALARAASIHGVTAAGSRIAKRADGLSLHVVSSDGYEHMFHDLRRDANGECLIDSLAAGDYSLSLMHSDGNVSAPCWTKRLRLKEGEKLTVQLGEMTGNLTLSGRVAAFTQVEITPIAKDSGGAGGPKITEHGVTSVAVLSDVDGYFEFDHVLEGTYQIEIGGLDRYSRRFSGLGSKGPTQIRMTQNTHIDYIAGTVLPKEAAIEPAVPKN